MRHSTDMPHPEEPLSKRLRSSKSRSDKAALSEKKQHLPSPRPTNPSSTDNITPSSSSVERNPKPKPAQSFRDRLLPPPKEAAPLPSVTGGPAEKRLHGKPSIAPFFKRIEAAFQEKPSATKGINSHAATTARVLSLSPSPDPENLVKQLKDHYLQTATSLHRLATAHLSQTHTRLTNKLNHTILSPDESFLAETEANIKKLSLPLDKFTIRSQQRCPGPDGTTAMRNEENSVGELLARAEEQVKEFEKEVGGLWQEWAVAEAEVKGVLTAIFPSPVDGENGDEHGGEREGDEADLLRMFRETIETEIAEAEEVVVELGEEAVGMMKEIEKDFRKATLPDLHAFFQSIDEP
ncbi:hypothetical protein MFIFM68171_05313 [Madurella fahalii]|uniref:Uncharacterized protein n=1 Tax=Madurella fahalii TaxID=1157608 RepID=A0ABQ0GBG2_9PEZI